RVMIGHHRSLLVIGQIDPHDRVIGRQQPAQPGQPDVAVAITPGQTATVTHGRPPRCAGIPSPATASGGRLHIQHRRAEELLADVLRGRTATYRYAGWVTLSRYIPSEPEATDALVGLNGARSARVGRAS